MFKLPQVIAHRGASAYAPENTIAALHEAQRRGASWVECDIQLSADLRLFVFHDMSLQRITGMPGKLAQQSSHLLAKLDAGHRFVDQFARQCIPSLELWLRTAAELGLALNLEIKAPVRQRATLLREFVRVWHSLCSKERPRQVLFSAAGLGHLDELRLNLPQFPRSLVVHRWHRHSIAQAVKTECYALHVNYKYLTIQRIADIKAAGLCVAAFTVNHKAQALQLLQDGVDSVFSDYPDLLRQAL